VRYKQPQAGPFDLDPKWISRGLVAPFSRYKLGATHDTAPVVVSGGVIAKSLTGGTNYLTYPNDAQYAITGPITLLTVFVIRSIGADQCFALKDSGDTNWYNTPWMLFVDATGHLKIGRATSSGGAGWYKTAETFSTNKLLVWGVSVPSGNVADLSLAVHYVNGVKQTNTLDYMSSPSAVADNGGVINIGTTLNNKSNASAVDLALLAPFNKALTEPELKSLTANPWQLFKDTRRIWVSVAATGIAFGAASNSGDQAAASTYTFNRTVTGSNTYLAVNVELLTVTGATVTSVIDDSGGGNVALAFIGAKSTVTGAGRVEMWGLANPTAGTKSIQVNLSASIESVATAESYTGVHQTAPTEAFNSAQATNAGSATDASVAITTVADNCWVVAACVANDTSIAANNTSRNNVAGTLGSGADEDNNAAKTPAGSVTMGFTGMGITTTWAIAGYAIRPLAASTPITGTAATGQGSQTVSASATTGTVITGTATSGQGSQTVTANAALQFIANPALPTPACTHAITTVNNAVGTGFTTGAFTPAAGDLLAVMVVTSSTTPITLTLSNSNGLTFSSSYGDSNDNFNTASRNTFLFIADQLASAVNQTCTLTCSGTSNGAVISIARISSMSRTGANAVRQNAVTTQAFGATPAPAFGVSVLTSNPTLGFLGNALNPSGITPPTGWTEQNNTGYNSNGITAGSEYVTRDSGFSGTTVTWGSASGSKSATIIAEFDASYTSTGQGSQTVDATATTGVAVSGTVATGQGSQSAASTALLQFLATATSGQGSQSVSAAASEAFTGTIASGQGSQIVSSAASLQFIGNTTSGQGSQSVTASVLLQFIATETSGNGSQSITASETEGFAGTAASGQGSQSSTSNALLQFIAVETSSQGSQGVAATANETFAGTATSGQGSQTVDATGAASAAITGTASSGQGSQSVTALAALRFIAAATSGQASQTVSATSQLQFVAAETSGQGAQTTDAVAALQFIATETSSQGSQTVDAVSTLQFSGTTATGQGSQTVDAVGANGNTVIGTATSGQGSQTIDAVATAIGGDVVSTWMDGVGVGVGNKSWMHNLEYVADHRVRHSGQAKTAQGQGSTAVGLVLPPLQLGAVVSEQAPQTTASIGYIINPYYASMTTGQASQTSSALGEIRDVELEAFAIAAAMLFDEEWRRAA